MQQLDIVLRTCDRIDVHSNRGPRFIEVDKATLIKKCLVSLCESIQQASHLADIRCWVLDDNSSPETVEYIQDTLTKYKVSFNIEICKEEGFNYSAYRQFELCKDNGRDLVYCVEDDYLHFPPAISQLLIMHNKLSNVTRTHVAIRPDDDLFTYSSNSRHSMKHCIVLLGEDRHWRTLTTSHNTIFTHVSVFKDYWELFASLGKFFKKLSINEDKTINMLWEGPVPLFSPIPTLACHISQNNEPPFVDIKSLWDSLKI